MAGPISIRVITPDEVLLDRTCSSISFPTVDGSVGVLKDHAPMVAAIGIGELTIRDEAGGADGVFVAGGFAEVRDNTVRIVSDVSELPSAIDLERARRAAERARERLEEFAAGRGEVHDLDLDRARAALARALMRQQVVSKYT